MKKAENFCRAVAQLEEAVRVYAAHPADKLYRDGLIQRFEFTVELAWKSAKEFLEDQGAVITYAAPRAVLKEAYAAGLIDQPDTWNDILTARNVTSHIYSEDEATRVAMQICDSFLPVLRSLAGCYSGQ